MTCRYLSIINSAEITVNVIVSLPIYAILSERRASEESYTGR